MRMIKSINKYLYGELGFRGADVYLNPDNSCLNMVLERRQGMWLDTEHMLV
jgi:regulator of sirC expression with transglutaminase-like and TPR domain